MQINIEKIYILHLADNCFLPQNFFLKMSTILTQLTIKSQSLLEKRRFRTFSLTVLTLQAIWVPPFLFLGDESVFWEYWIELRISTIIHKWLRLISATMEIPTRHKPFEYSML